MNKKQLLPCGCGGEAHHYSTSCWNPEEEEWIPNFWHRVICKNCRTQTKAFYSKAEAVQAWNRAMGERKKGKWIVISEFEDCCYIKCNQCKITQVFYYNKPLTNFCPHCGADMRNEQ